MVSRPSLKAIFFAVGVAINSIAVAYAETLPKAVVTPGIFFSDDSEGFTTWRAGAEIATVPNTDLPIVGIRYRHHEFEQDNWSENAEQIALVLKKGATYSNQYWQAEVGALEQGGHTLLTLDANAIFPVAQNLNAEFFINRDFVETREALGRGIHFTFVGTSLDYLIHPKLTVIGLVGHQRFSDDSHRNHGRIRLIFQPDLDLGLTFQYRYRYYNRRDSVITGAYFSPESYQENMLLTGWRKRYEGWTFYALGGVGLQKVADAPKTNTRLFELSLKSPVSKLQQISLHTGYSKSAAFGGPDYHYTYIQGSWSIQF